VPFSCLGEHLAVELPGARAVFTTRRGGVSAPPYDSLNLGFLTGDDPAAVSANRRVLADTLGVNLAWVRQVHGSEVRVVVAPTEPGHEVPEADGLATTSRGLGLMALAADCLPIVIAGGGAVAVVHAGWHGLAEGVIANGVATVRRLGRGGTTAAAIGPGAGVCCYEVSEELHWRFAGYGPEVRRGRNLDLVAVARRQLVEAGVRQVEDSGLCTMCADPGLLFSHRRDGGLTGRQAAVAWLS